MFVFGTTMLKCEGYSDKLDFFNNNDRNGGASISSLDFQLGVFSIQLVSKKSLNHSRRMT